MGRRKGSKNKLKQIEKETMYYGYFILDSGDKINFEISEEDGGEAFALLLDCEWSFGKNDVIWIGDSFILASRVAGFQIDTYET